MHVCYTLFMGDRAIRFISNFTNGEFIILLPERLQPFINSLSWLSLLAHLHQLPLISHYSDYLISAPSATPEFKHPTCRILRAFRIPAEADRLPGVNHLFLRLGNLPSYERASAPPPVAASSDRFPPILTNHFVSTIVHYTMRENTGCVGYMNCNKILYL